MKISGWKLLAVLAARAGNTKSIKKIGLALAVTALISSAAHAVPTPLGIYWDGSGDPTTLDSNSDGVNDWVVRGGGAFTGDTTGGIYTPGSGQLIDTRPLYAFDSAFDVCLGWKSGGNDDWDAMFWVNVDPAGDPYAAVFFSLLDEGSSQTLNVWNKPNDVHTLLASYTGLADDFLDMTFAFDGAGQVAVTIEGTTYAALSYSTTTTPNSDAFATILGNNMQLDYIGISADCHGVPDAGSTSLLLGVALLGLGSVRRRI